MTKKPSVLPRNLGNLFLVAVSLALLFFFSVSSIEADEETQLVFSPPAIDLVSTAVTVAVRVENVTNLYGLELDVLFDPTIVDVESIAPGDFLSVGFVVSQTVDSNAGKASLVFTQIAPQQGRSGSGNVAVLTLKATSCSGHSPLRLAKVILSNSDGQAIAHTITRGTATSGSPLLDRQISGSIYHDIDENGQPSVGEPLLGRWPIFLQRLSVEPSGPEQVTFSQSVGSFQFENISCGRYQLWTQNGDLRVLTQTLDLPAATDVNSVSFPLTGTLKYPWHHLFLPVLTR